MHAAGTGIAVPSRRADRRDRRHHGAEDRWQAHALQHGAGRARRQPPVVRVRLGGRARLPGRGRRHRRAGGAGQPFDLYTGRHRRARGPPAQGRRQAGHRPTLAARAQAGRELPLDLAAHCPKTQTLRVLPGLYDHRLEPESAATFYQDAWTVTSEADRIGYRYKQGRALRFREREQPFGAGADPSTSSTPAIPSARSRCRPAWSPSSCTATRCPAAATP